MNNKFLQVVFSLLFFANWASAGNVNVTFTTMPNNTIDAALNAEFYTVQKLQLNNIAVFNNADKITITIDGAAVLHTEAKRNKLFAPNYVLREKTTTGIVTHTLQDIGFDGQYFCGKNAAGNTNAAFSWFNNTIQFAFTNNGVEYFIEPLANYISGAANNEYVYFSKANIKPTNKECGTHAPASNTPIAMGSGGANCVVMEYAIMADQTMYNKYGSLAGVVNKTVSVTNLVQTDYTVADGISTDICYLITEHYIATCAACNPWPSTFDIGDNLDSITEQGAQIFSLPYDLASYYFAQSDPGSNTVGLAWINTMCDYNTFPGAGSYSCNAIRDYSSNLNNMRNLVSHEIGHNFNARHDTVSNAEIMNPTVNGSAIWSTWSKTNINNTISNISCLTPCAPIAGAAGICDTQGTYVTSIFNDSINSQIIVKWAAFSGISYTFRALNTTTNTWSPLQTIASGVDSAVYAYTFAGCNNQYILEITPSCGPGILGAPLSAVYNISKNAKPQITIVNANGNNAICGNASVNLTSTSLFSGSAPTYQWYKNNVLIVGATLANYTIPANSFATGDQFYCIMTSNYPCLLAPNDTSNVISITVSPTANPSISLNTTSNPACAGAVVTIFAAISNGGTTPIRQWRVNGLPVGGNTTTYTSTTFQNGDVITCELTSSLTCVTNNVVFSLPINMVVNASVVPTVSISSPNAVGCNVTGGVNFSAISVNGGAAPAYQWKVNGVVSGTNSPAFTSTTLNSGDVVEVVLTSNAFCAVPKKDTSNSITINVLPAVTPVVNIAVDLNPTCGSNVSNFTATSTGGGTLPAYAWFINSVQVAAPDSTGFGKAFFNNGDTVYCVMTTNAPCATSFTDTSNIIIMNITPPITPTITITSSPGNTICQGQTVTYTATFTNGGSNPSFVWKVSGVPVAGVTGTTFSSNSITTGSLISVLLTSNSPCVTAANATSNSLPLTVRPLKTPTIVITGDNVSICDGDSVGFTSTQTVAGNAPTYQWKLDGVNKGTSVNTFNTSVLAIGTHTVTCDMTSNSNQCLTSPTVTSNQWVIIVTQKVTPDVTIVASTNNVCFGTTITFTATPINGGTTPNYAWKKNGLPTGGNNNVINVINGNNNDVIECVLTSSEGCVTKLKDTSNKITLIIKPLVTPFVSVKKDTNGVCQNDLVTWTAINAVNTGTAPIYTWFVNGVANGVTGTTFASSTLITGDVITVKLTSNADCATPPTVTSKKDTITIYPPATPDISISASDSTTCIGQNVNFTSTSVDQGANPVYQWFWNGLPHGTNNSTYNNTLLETNDSIFVVLTSNAKCLTKTQDTSVAIYMIVNDNISPTIAITQSISNAAAGTPITYTATTPVIPNYTIQWFRNGAVVATTTGLVWNTTATSAYDSVYAKIYNYSGCYLATSALSNKVILRPFATSINGIVPTNFAVYPNPVQNFATVEGLEANDEITLLDATGKIIYKSTATTNGNLQLDMNAYSSGMYLARFTRGNQHWVVRLQKQ